MDVLDGADPCDDLDPRAQGSQDLLSDRCCGDTAYRFSSRSAPAAGRCADAILRIVGIIGMRRPVFHRHFLICGGALVGVSHHDGDGCAEGFSIMNTGEDFRSIRLFAGSDDFRLARTAAVELRLDLL